MHGDRVSAVIQSDKDREVADPETLIEPFLTRFVGRIQKKDDRLSIIPDHPLLKRLFSAALSVMCSMTSRLATGQWLKCAVTH